MQLKVVFDNTLVKIIEDSSKIVISEGLHVPEKGEVVEVGEGTTHRPMQVRPGMTVYFYKRDAQKLEVNKEEYYVLSQVDILAYEED